MKLSIAIPTYNRANFLRENLANLRQQILNLDQAVEVVISDNASTDDTESVVYQIFSEDIIFKYLKNKTNLGMDINANLAIHACQGQFVLLLADDDLLESNAIKAILDCIKKYPKLGIAYLNFRTYDHFVKNEINFRDLAFDPFDENSYFPDGICVFEKSRKIFAAISGGIYRRDLWENANAPRFYGSVFIHVGITLDILCRMRAPAYIFKEPLFKYRLNNSLPGKIKPYQDIFEVSFGLLGILLTHKKYLPTNIFREMYIKELSWARKNVLGAKSRESVRVKETFLQMRKSYDTSRLDFWLIDVPILMIPQWMLYVPYQLYRRIRYRKI